MTPEHTTPDPGQLHQDRKIVPGSSPDPGVPSIDDLYANWKGRVRYYCGRAMRRNHFLQYCTTLEDLTQESWTRICRYYRHPVYRYDPSRASLGTWILRIVNGLCSAIAKRHDVATKRRDQPRRRQVLVQEPPDPREAEQVAWRLMGRRGPTPDVAQEPPGPSCAPCVEQQVIEEDAAWLRGALHSLPKTSRTLLILEFWYGWSVPTIEHEFSRRCRRTGGEAAARWFAMDLGARISCIRRKRRQALQYLQRAFAIDQATPRERRDLGVSALGINTARVSALRAIGASTVAEAAQLERDKVVFTAGLGMGAWLAIRAGLQRLGVEQ